MRRLPPLQFGLLVLLVAAQASAKSSDNVLNNAQGQSPCAMQTKFLDTCETSRRRDDGNTNSSLPPSTPCTCTNVFFNLWSACTWTKSDSNNSTPAVLPPCEAWMQQCEQASIEIRTIPQDASSSYPKWAYMVLPSNGSFDLPAAVESTKAPHWTTAQILLPILVGLAVAATLSLCFFFVICRRRRAKHERPWMRTDGNRPRFQFPTISSVTKVRELDRSNSWNIDERESPLDEYQFVSYPNSMQGSHVGGHVRLSSSSSGTQLPGPPPLKISSGKTEPVRAWPGKAIWKGPLQSARMLRETLPLPWRSAKRVAVKNVPSYNKFRVDAPDSDSPLSQRTHLSLLGGAGRSRSNLHNETIFEEDSDSDTEDLPLIPQKPSHDDAEPSPGPSDNVMWVPPARPNQTNAAQRSPRQIPPSNPPPKVPLPSLPSPPLPPRITQRPPPTPPSVNTPLSPPQSTGRPRIVPAFPPAPTSPPPPRPSIPSRSPRAPRIPLPPQNTVPPPLPVTSPPRRTVPPPLLLASPPHPQPLLARAPSTDAAVPFVRTHARSDSGSVRSLPMTPTRSDSSSMRLPTTPTPPYVRGAPTPNQTSESPTDATGTPPHSAPPSYVQRPSQDLVHSPNIPATAPGENARSVRRLPLPPA